MAKLLWEIGKADGGNAEFALAPKDYSQFSEDGFFIVGRSDAARDWPYVHPGPSDGWAGGREHAFTVVFGVKRAPREGTCRLLLDLLDTQAKQPPMLRIEVNSGAFDFGLPAGGGDASIQGALTKGKPHHVALDFPATLLKTGNNRIAIISVKGSWLLYDRLALEAPAAVEAAAVANPGKLRPLAPKPPKIEQVIVVFKTHFDIGYTDMASNVVARYRTTMIDQALEVVDQNRDLPPAQQFAWTIPGWPMHQILDWPEQTAERKQRVLQAFKDGRFVVHALPFSTHTELLEVEDLVRGLGHASKLARAAGLKLPRDAKMTDVPCHAWVMPTLLKRAGVDFLHIGCNSASSSPRVPALFWWQGPDGSRLLTYYSAGGYGSGLMSPAGWPHKTWLALIHTGDNHGPPTPDEVKKLLDQAAKQLPGVKVRIGRLSDFAEAVLAEKPKLRVVRGDMPDTWIHGPMCDPFGAMIGRNIRPAIATTEALGASLRAWGVKTPDAATTIASAYENSLLYGEHTWGGALYWITKYGGGTKFGYGDKWKADRTEGRFQRLEESWAEHTAYIEKARDLITPLLDGELRALASSVNTGGTRIVVFNPLPWKRDGQVSVSLGKSLPGISGLKPSDGGDVVPAESSGGTLRFVARDVPAMGYRCYVPVKADALAVLAANAQAETIENPFLKVTLDPARGTIRSLVDKRTGRELTTTGAPHGLGQYLYERFSENETMRFINAYAKQKTEWFIAEFGKPNLPPASEAPYRAVSPRNFKLRFEQSPVAVTAVMEAAASAELPHAVTTRVTLFRDQPWLELAVTLHDKPADPWPEAGWICLPVNAEQPQFRLGRQAAIVDPTRDIVSGANRHLFGVNSGFTITDPHGRGIGFCALDHPLMSLGEPGCWNYSLDYLPKKPIAYVNLFNNQWTTNFRYWNSGTWTSRVRLWPITRADADAALVTPSLEARSPLLAAVADGAPGKLPPTQRGLELSRKGVQVTAFGANPDGEGTVLRLWELAGKSGPCRVTLPGGFNARVAQPVNLRGEPAGKPIRIAQGQFNIELRAFAPASFVFDTKP